MSGMMTGALLDGTKVGNKRMTLPQVHFRLEIWISVPPVVRNGLRLGEDEPEHRSCSEHIPIELWSRGSRRWNILSDCQWSEWIPDVGAGQFQGYDENGLLRFVNGRLTGVHKVLCRAAEIACKGRQDFNLGHDGGYMIPIHSKIGQGMKTHFEK